MVNIHWKAGAQEDCFVKVLFEIIHNEIPGLLASYITGTELLDDIADNLMLSYCS